MQSAEVWDVSRPQSPLLFPKFRNPGGRALRSHDYPDLAIEVGWWFGEA